MAFPKENDGHGHDRLFSFWFSPTPSAVRWQSKALRWRAVRYKTPERNSTFQSSRAPELRGSKAPELQSAIRSFFTIFSRWWIRTACLVVYRYHHMAAAVGLHVADILFFSDFAEDEGLPELGSHGHCIYHGRHALKRPPFSPIRRLRCLQVMANIAQAEETGRSVTAQTQRLLEEPEAWQKTTEASYICLAYDRLGSKERFRLCLHH